MSLTADHSATEDFRGTAGAGNDHRRPLHHLVSERTTPLPIRGRTSVLQVPFVDSTIPSGSIGASHTRRLHRDSFHERRDHRSFSAEWISSPLLEGFASFHSALNSVQEVASNLGTSASSHDDMSCSLPYLGTCWSHDHSGESSVGSSRSTQSSLVSTDTSTASSMESSSLVLDDWDLLKTRTLSTDMTSPVPIENFMPFLFPMDPDAATPHTEGHFSAPTPAFGVNDVHATTRITSTNGCEGSHHTSSVQPVIVGHYIDIKPEHQPQTPQGQWTCDDHQQVIGPMSGPRMEISLSGNQVAVSSHAPLYGTTTASTRAPLHPLSLQHPSQATMAPSSMLLSTTALNQMHSTSAMAMSTAMASSASRLSSISTSPSLPLADIQLLTKLNQCYWKNGRKNLQCFPICPEHNDFYSMKMSNRKHTSVGVCRGPVYSHVFLPACSPHTKPSRTTGQHMKYEFGVGASGTGGSAFEVFVLGKFERVPQQDENDALQDLLPAPEDFTSSSAFEAFRYSCFQAVEMEERRMTTRAASDVPGLPEHIVRSTWFFLPDVWKVQPMLKKKRKATRSAPAQAFPFCFRVFVYAREPSSTEESTHAGPYRCLATAASSFFELYSTRTVDRVKRKYWGPGNDETNETMEMPMATTPSSTHVAKRVSRA